MSPPKWSAGMGSVVIPSPSDSISQGNTAIDVKPAKEVATTPLLERYVITIVNKNTLVSLARPVQAKGEAWTRALHTLIQTRQIVKGLLRNPDVAPLTRGQIKQTVEYAREILGNSRYARWLQIYTMYRGQFQEGWIPDDYFAEKVLPRVNHSYRSISAAKTLSSRILAETGALPDQMYRISGQWYDSHGMIPTNTVREVLKADGHQAIVIKQEESSQGRGVTIATVDECETVAAQIVGNLVVQSYVDPNSWFLSASPGGVVTLRITTVLDRTGCPRIASAYLRLARDGSKIIRSDRSLRVPIGLTDGTLGEFASASDWSRHHVHPDTDFVFSGQRIPHFLRATQQCVALHTKVPQFGIVGWDVIITNAGEAKVLEWNVGHPGIKFSEASSGPCFLQSVVAAV